MTDPVFIGSLLVFCNSKGFSPFNSNCKVIRTVKWFLLNTLQKTPLLTNEFYDLDLPKSASRLEIDKLQVQFNMNNDKENHITLVLTSGIKHHFVITFEPFSVSFQKKN